MAFHGIERDILGNNLRLENEFAFYSLPHRDGDFWVSSQQTSFQRASVWLVWAFWAAFSTVAAFYVVMICAHWSRRTPTAIIPLPAPQQLLHQQAQNVQDDVALRAPGVRAEIDLTWDVVTGNVQHVSVSGVLLAKAKKIRATRTSAAVTL